MGNLYKSKRLKIAYDIEVMAIIIASTIVQLMAGGKIVHYITGLNYGLMTLILSATVLIYSWLRGIKASILTDVYQMILMIIAVIVTTIFLGRAGFDFQWGGIKNLDTHFFSALNWQYFIAFGMIMTLTTLVGPPADQMYWQRAIAMEEKNIKKSFVLSSVLFATIPIGMGIIGFTAAAKGFVPKDVTIVGLEYITKTMPVIVVILFLLALIAGLSSTMDSCVCAMGSVFSKFSKKTETIGWARIGMIVTVVVGMLAANIKGLNFWSLYITYATLRIIVSLPTVITMLSLKVPSESSVFNGILVATLIGLPIYIWGQIIKSPYLSISGLLLALIIPLLFIFIGNKKQKVNL
jgi:Na+/proline symporter